MAPSTTNSIDGLPPVSLRRVEVTASMEAATAPPPPSPPPRASPIGAASPSPAAIAAPESFPAAKQHKNQYEKPVEANFWDQQIAQGNLSMCSVKYPTYVNVMLYGESGLGKTTTIKNLIGSWGIKKAGAAFSSRAAAAANSGPGSSGVGETGKSSLDRFLQDPDSMRVELEPVTDETSNLEMHFSFQDMPGWGDDINLVNSLRTVVDFLLKQRQKDYVHNKAGLTEHCAAPGTVIQHGITVCLYLVPPHRVKPIDWIMMAAISKLVAVIPVIAKADTFTAQEMQDYRQELLKVIRHAAGAPAADGSSSRSLPTTPAGAAQPELSIGQELRSRSASRSKSSTSTAGTPKSAASAPAGSFGGRVVAMPLDRSLFGQGDIRASMQEDSFTERTGNDSDPIQLARSLCLETYAFRTSDLDLVNASPEQLPPFAIIASKDVVTPEDEKWTAADGAQVGQPIRRYRWGTAFPLNRDHSDLIILKQLLFGHRNFAVHDLLQDSWRRAHIFAQEYEALLAEQQQERISARGSLREVSIQPLVDALCSSTFGGPTELADKLRSAEAKEVMTKLSKANQELAHRVENEKKLSKQVEQLKADECALRLKLGQQQATIDRLSAELEKAKRRWRIGS